MKVCFPAETDRGPESLVHDHFGSAPLFLIFDTDTRTAIAAVRPEPGQGHGARRVISALAPHGIDAVVTGGIGPGALGHLQGAGWTVYGRAAATIAENLELLALGRLTRAEAHAGCSEHRGMGPRPGSGGCSGH